MTRIKVCGICRLQDACQASELGAWAIGFIFHPGSPRFIEPAAAAELLWELRRHESHRERLRSGHRVRAVGVFVDRPADEVAQVARAVNLDVAQLHGDESRRFIDELRGQSDVEELEIWKAFRVGDGFDSTLVEELPSGVRPLLDTLRPGQEGGTGETFDWELVRDLASQRQVILAGGIGPENVVDAVRAVRPWAIDASSRLELSPGVKSPDRVRQLFERLGDGGASPE